MRIYFDETIHEKLGFMLLAYVFCQDDPQQKLAETLARYKKQEFHALETMQGNEDAQKLRSEIREYVNNNCRWGIIVLPSNMRWNLVDELPNFINGLISTLTVSDSVSLFLDEGIIQLGQLQTFKEKVKPANVTLCKSHEVNGIQLADLTAALNGIRLKEEIGQTPKMLTYGDESGFNPPIQAELGFELWASLRYSMYRDCKPAGQEMPEMAQFNTIGYGLFISEKCSPALRTATEKVFGQIYLGCFH